MVRHLGIDLTACWRPRAGMVTLAIGLAGRMLAAAGTERRYTLFCSRERPPALPVDGSRLQNSV
jgi:hypothetical protein